MKYKHFRWTVEHWKSLETKIDPQPQYQRGDVWDAKKRSLLIDSILSGYDIPKVYLRRLKTGGTYDYDVADGQQRLKAIWRFLDDNLVLSRMSTPMDALNGKTWSQLTAAEQHTIKSYVIVATVVYDATNGCVRELFRRLQLGVKLNPAELRNSKASAIGDQVRAIALTHPFFKNGPFTVSRYKVDDLVAHAFAAMLYGSEHDMKARLLDGMYDKYAARGAPAPVIARLNAIFKFMDDMQQHVPKCIRTKWGVVDLVGVLADNNPSTLDPKAVATHYQTWERDRMRYADRLEELNAASGPRKEALFSYISAFLREGALKKNLKTRRRVLAKVLLGRLP